MKNLGADIDYSISITDETVVNKIYQVRGKRVMLDRDLAEMWCRDRSAKTSGKKKSIQVSVGFLTR